MQKVRIIADRDGGSEVRSEFYHEAAKGRKGKGLRQNKIKSTNNAEVGNRVARDESNQSPAALRASRNLASSAKSWAS